MAKSKAEKKKNKGVGKKDVGEKKNADKAGNPDTLLSKAKVPAAASGGVLIGATGAATLRKSRTRKGRLLRKAAKPSNPVLSAAGSQARKLKKLVPGA